MKIQFNLAVLLGVIAFGFTMKAAEPAAVPEALYSPEGAYIVTAEHGAGSRVWDSRTGTLIRTLPLPAPKA